MALSTVELKDLRAALDRYSKEELVELMEHLLRIYVLDEPLKLDGCVSKPESIKDLTGCSFAQLISLLQTSLEIDELEKFRVTPFTVYVKIGEAEFDLNGPTPTLARADDEGARNEDDADEDDDGMSPAQKLDGVSSRPWRNDHLAKPAKSSRPAAATETPSMADLFAEDKARGYSLFTEPPSAAQDEDDFAPPIADVAPGDDPEVASNEGGSNNDYAKTAASRDEASVAAAPPPPALASGDKQIDPSNRFASLDLD